MNKYNGKITKKEQLFARGIGQIEIASSPYTTEFINAERQRATRRQLVVPIKEPSSPTMPIPLTAKVFRQRRVFLAVVLLCAVLSLSVFVLGVVQPKQFAFFTKENGKLITVSDPILGGFNKFFGANYTSEFYNDCLKYVENAPLATAISFYFLPFVISFTALLPLLIIIFAVVALFAKSNNRCVNYKPPINVLFILQLFCIAAIFLSGVLWNSAGAGELSLFFVGGSTFLSVGGGLYVLMTLSIVAPFLFCFAYKKIK